jgi:hypothetical protein
MIPRIGDSKYLFPSLFTYSFASRTRALIRILQREGISGEQVDYLCVILCV